MEVNYQTLAQRKAAKRSQMETHNTGNSTSQTESVHFVSNEMHVPNVTLPAAVTTVQAAIQTAQEVVAPQAIASPPAAAHTIEARPSQPNGSLSKDDIIKLAQSHGLKFEGARREFVKHTYSVTLESKALFKKYCDTLGYNMQDAMEESLQDFFKKHGLEYARVRSALNK